MDNVIDYINSNKLGKCIENESMRYHTTMRVGGKVKLLYIPDNIENLALVVKYLRQNSVKFFILGRGSNLIFGDQEYDMVVIKIASVLNFKEVDGENIIVGAGYSIARLAKEVSKLGLSGLEFAGGIPGTVGGAIYMNAGAHLGDMSKVVENVTVIDSEGHFKILKNSDCFFTYRRSIFQENNDIIVGCTMKLVHDDSASVYKRMAGNLEYRKEMQPLELPSVGSTFRNPDGYHAGKLIEEAGLKGYRIGDACVSEKHANFIVNIGDASASDVTSLVEYVQKVVFEKTGIRLETEFIRVDCNER